MDLLIKKELIPAKLKSKSMLLSTKRNLINQVYEEAKKQFTATSGKEYKTIIKQLLKANPLKGKVEIIPCQANEKDTKVALEEAAKSAKLEITWSDPTPTISGGFIAKQGLIDFDYSFDTYFKTIRKTLEDEIIKLLFKS
ncbi:MAG: V-type ATP synthase subunit E [Candidatus Margulisbacteria bacterium]|nr:V-type ATP synthase subunit E [Candidatus Margulisiibacteriota bacterium]